MPRMQVYLPEDLYEVVKNRALPASELLQRAVRAEVRRLELLEATDRYLTELEAEVGQPSAAERDDAEVLVRRLQGQTQRKAG